MNNNKEVNLVEMLKKINTFPNGLTVDHSFSLVSSGARAVCLLSYTPNQGLVSLPFSYTSC